MVESICAKKKLLRRSQASMAPSRNVSSPSRTMSSGSNSSVAPKPSHPGHAPLGLLNENSFGSPIFLGSAAYTAGSLAGLLTFTSSGPGAVAGIGADGFGIFLGANQTSGSAVSTFYLGYDDQITNIDDNHDDMIIRVTVLPPVPEPATWMTMLLGFAAVGVGMRRRKRVLGVQAA